MAQGRKAWFEALTLGNLTEGVLRSTLRWLSVQGDLGDPRPPASQSETASRSKASARFGAHSGRKSRRHDAVFTVVSPALARPRPRPRSRRRPAGLRGSFGRRP